MTNSLFVKNVLENFHMQIDQEKLDNCSFSLKPRIVDDGFDLSITVYPFFTERPYLLVVMYNNFTYQSREILYENSTLDHFDFTLNKDGQDTLVYTPYDLERLTELIANKYVELFELGNFHNAYDYFGEFYDQLKNILKEYHEDPRVETVEQYCNVKADPYEYLDEEMDLERIVVNAKDKYDGWLNDLILVNQSVNNTLRDLLESIKDSEEMALSNDELISGLRRNEDTLNFLEENLFFRNDGSAYFNMELTASEIRDLHRDIILNNSKKTIKDII